MYSSYQIIPRLVVGMGVISNSVGFLLLFPALILGLLARSSTADDPARNVLYAGEVLRTNDKLTWGDYRFIMQEDCNLVLYEGSGGGIWTTQTNGQGRNCYVRLQRDGNLVVYSGGHKPLWKSDTASVLGSYVLVLQKDRNVVIYGISRWSTGTAGFSHNSSASLIKEGTKYSIAEQPNNVLYTGEVLRTNEELNWGNFRFIMQDDCNLVLYNNGPGLWTSKTNGRGRNCYVVFERDGNLVIFNGNNNLLWSTTNQWGEGDYVCILQKDLKVTIYGEARWGTDTGYSNQEKIAMATN